MSSFQKVKIVEGSKLDRKISERLSFIKNNILDIGTEKVIASKSVVSSDIVQKLFWSKSSSRLDNIIDDLIKDACITAETLGGGGGEIVLSLIVDILNLEKNNVSYFDPVEFQSSICGFYHKFYRNRLRQSLAQLNEYPGAYFIAKEILRSSGRSTVSIKRSNHLETKINITMGGVFDTSSPSALFEKKKKISKKDASVFIVDGIVESVSEIHTILEKASETGEPYVIIARSFLPDVITTIMFNVLRGTIDVMPVSVNIDENTFNVFTDLGVICNSPVITHLEGDTISQGSKRELVKVKSVTISQDSLQIFNPDSSDHVNSHIRNLSIRESKTESHVESEILNDRIRRLSQNMTYVEIGHAHISEDPMIIEKLDKFFRSYITMIKYGIIEKRDLLAVLKKYELKNSYNLIKNLKTGCISSKLLESCVKISRSCADSISSTGCIIYSDI